MDLKKRKKRKGEMLFSSLRLFFRHSITTFSPSSAAKTISSPSFSQRVMSPVGHLFCLFPLHFLDIHPHLFLFPRCPSRRRKMTTGIFLSFRPSFVSLLRVCVAISCPLLQFRPIPCHIGGGGGGENVKGPGKIKEEEAATILTPLQTWVDPRAPHWNSLSAANEGTDFPRKRTILPPPPFVSGTSERDISRLELEEGGSLSAAAVGAKKGEFFLKALRPHGGACTVRMG